MDPRITTVAVGVNFDVSLDLAPWAAMRERTVRHNSH